MGVELVASVAARDFQELLRAARDAAFDASDPDVVELRLDGLSPEWLARAAADPGQLAPLGQLARDLRPELLVACHGPEAFGAFEGPGRARLDLLRAAASQGIAWVDVHVDLAADLGDLPAPTRLLVSEHVLDGTPDDVELGRRLARLRAVAGPAGRTKFVTHADDAEDGLRLLLAGRAAGGESVFFCTGAAGCFTRALAPLVGGAAVYAAVGRATAPGQPLSADLRAAWPVGGASSATRALAVVGAPIAHSRSPAVHGAAQRAAGLDAVFVALEPTDFPKCFELVDRFDPLVGLAVTAPFKLAALQCAAAADRGARAVGAANTLVRGAGGWTASNTDVTAVGELAADTPAGKALVLGAGGAARAAVVALREGGWRVTIAARREAAAGRLADETQVGWCPWAERSRSPFDLVVQATPLGGPTTPRELPMELKFEPQRLIEANYGSGPTPLVELARSRGVSVADGRDWFVAQAKAQFERFHRTPPPSINWGSVFDGSRPT